MRDFNLDDDKKQKPRIDNGIHHARVQMRVSSKFEILSDNGTRAILIRPLWQSFEWGFF